MVTHQSSWSASAEQRLKELGIKLPAPPEPFGTYVESVQTGNLLFLSGMLPTEGHGAKFIGRVGAELDVEKGRKAAHLAALNVLAVARQHLGSLDKITRIVRLGVSVATSRDVRDQPKVADAASELLHAGTIALNSTLLFSIGFATGHLEGQERINVFLSIPLLCLVTLSICPFVPSADAQACGAEGVAVQVLGSGGPELKDKRASSSYLVWQDGRARVLVDAGGGSALRFGESGAKMSQLDVILFSHFHVDHSEEFPWHIARGAKTGFVSGLKSGDGYKFPLAFAPADVIADHFETHHTQALAVMIERYWGDYSL